MTGVLITAIVVLGALAGVFFGLYQRSERRHRALVDDRARLEEERDGLADALKEQVAALNDARESYRAKTKRVEEEVDRLRARLRESIGRDDRARVVDEFVDEFVRDPEAEAGGDRGPG